MLKTHLLKLTSIFLAALLIAGLASFGCGPRAFSYAEEAETEPAEEAGETEAFDDPVAEPSEGSEGVGYGSTEVMEEPPEIVPEEETTDEEAAPEEDAAPARLPEPMGAPAGQTEAISRIAGLNRFATALEAAERLKTELGVETFDTIIIASGRDYADALSGSYLAYVKQAPILLAGGDTQELAEYVKTSLTEGGTVYILGGTAAVPGTVDDALDGIKIKRLAGDNRYVTNVKILKEAGVTGNDILVCSGTGFADSLSASAAGRPILLVGTTMVPKQREYLHDLTDSGYELDLYIIGGRGAINLRVEDQCKSFGTVTRIQGSNRYKTSVAVAEQFFPDAVDTVVLAYGEDFPDGLAGGPVAASVGAPMLLVKNDYTVDARTFAASKGAEYCIVMGGTALISDGSAAGVLQ